jgi:hypothetical protein
LPPFVTTNVVPVELPIAKAGAAPSAAIGLIERRAHGEEVPTPTNPVPRIVVVPVVPKYAVPAESWVLDALPLKSIREVVALCPAAGCVQASYAVSAELEMVIGEEPKATKLVQEALPEQETVVVAAPAPPAM